MSKRAGTFEARIALFAVVLAALAASPTHAADR
jgi:hypothetical protein